MPVEVSSVAYIHSPRVITQCVATVTAAIYRNDFGLELRIDLAAELIHTQEQHHVADPTLNSGALHTGEFCP